MKTTELLLETPESGFQMTMMYKLLKRDLRADWGIHYRGEFTNSPPIVVFYRNSHNSYDCSIRYVEKVDAFLMVFKKNEGSRLIKHDIKFEDVPDMLSAGFNRLMQMDGIAESVSMAQPADDRALVWHLVAQLLEKRKFVQFYASSRTGRFINGQITSISPNNFISFSRSCSSAIMFICPDDDDLFTLEKRAGRDMYVVKNIKNIESAHEDL